MKWIRTHKILTAFIMIVLALCVVICVSYLRGGGLFLDKAVETGNAAVTEPLSSMTNGIKSGFRGIFQFRSIVAENEELKEENTELKRQINELTLQQKELQELRELSNVLNYESIAGSSEVMAADIIGIDGSNWFNIFVINKGSESGIEKDDIVVNGSGLVGRISETGNGWSKVIGIIDESNKVSFELLFRDEPIMGIVQGDGSGGLTGFMFKADAGVIEGDILITSGVGIYPAGIEIGRVSEVDYSEDTQLKTITVEPTADFTGMKKVAVII